MLPLVGFSRVDIETWFELEYRGMRVDQSKKVKVTDAQVGEVEGIMVFIPATHPLKKKMLNRLYRELNDKAYKHVHGNQEAVAVGLKTAEVS